MLSLLLVGFCLRGVAVIAILESAAQWGLRCLAFLHELFEISAAFDELECALLLDGLRLGALVIAGLAGILDQAGALHAA